MKQYRGYYIDHMVFNTKADIDAFIRKQMVEHYKMLCEEFEAHSTMAASMVQSEYAQYMVANGFTWDEVEAIEENY